MLSLAVITRQGKVLQQVSSAINHSLTPKPQTLNPKPYTLNPKLQTLNSKP